MRREGEIVRSRDQRAIGHQ